MCKIEKFLDEMSASKLMIFFLPNTLFFAENILNICDSEGQLVSRNIIFSGSRALSKMTSDLNETWHISFFSHFSDSIYLFIFFQETHKL